MRFLQLGSEWCCLSSHLVLLLLRHEQVARVSRLFGSSALVNARAQAAASAFENAEVLPVV